MSRGLVCGLWCSEWELELAQDWNVTFLGCNWDQRLIAGCGAAVAHCTMTWLFWASLSSLENGEVEMDKEVKMNSPIAVFLSWFLMSSLLHWIHVSTTVIRNHLLIHFIFWEETCDRSDTVAFQSNKVALLLIESLSWMLFNLCQTCQIPCLRFPSD